MRPVPSDAAPGRLDAHEANALVVDEAGEDPDRVRPASHARDDRVGEPALRVEHLLSRLAADHRLELADELGVRRRPDAGADHVVGRLDVRDPVADRLAGRLLQRPRADLHRLHARAEEVHALDVGRLAAHVLGSHVDDAFEPEAGTGGGGRHAVLAGPGLGDDARLPEATSEHDLAERVVDLVRARVVQVLALEVEPPVRCEPLRASERRRAPDVGAEQSVELRCESRRRRAARSTPR